MRPFLMPEFNEFCNEIGKPVCYNCRSEQQKRQNE